MTPTSALAVAAWSLVAGRLLVLGSRALRARHPRPVSRPVAEPDPEPAAAGWRPRVTSGCGR